MPRLRPLGTKNTSKASYKRGQRSRLRKLEKIKKNSRKQNRRK